MNGRQNGQSNDAVSNIQSENDTQTNQAAQQAEVFIEPEIAPAPPKGGKIKGYWASQFQYAIPALSDDIDRIKEDGINLITFSPSLSHQTDEERARSSGPTSPRILSGKSYKKAGQLIDRSINRATATARTKVSARRCTEGGISPFDVVMASCLQLPCPPARSRRS